MDDSISRFWDRYISKITDNNVPQGARRWYVRHLELFIESRAGRRLAATTREEVECYIDEIGRMENVAAWQYRQVIDSLRILFSEMVKVAWFEEIDWRQMMDDARDLPESHATVARAVPLSGQEATGTDTGNSEEYKRRFKVLYDRLIIEVRSRQYSIRTVQDLLGHANVSTTMIYTHVLNKGGRGVKSPLDV